MKKQSFNFQKMEFVFSDKNLISLIGNHVCVDDENRKAFNFTCKKFYETWQTKILPRKSQEIIGKALGRMVWIMNIKSGFANVILQMENSLNTYVKVIFEM